MSFLSQQLCIVDSNSAELGKYFTDPGHATEATLAAARTREIGKFFNPDPNAVAAAEAVKTAAATSAQYRVNDTIAATGAPGGVFTLPGKTLSGTSGYTNVVGFGLPIPSAIDSYASECDVDLSTLETACTGSTLNSVNLVDNLRLASTKGSSPTMITPSVSSAKSEGLRGPMRYTAASDLTTTRRTDVERPMAPNKAWAPTTACSWARRLPSSIDRSTVRR